MITKSKLHEIEKFWKKLEKSESSNETVGLVKKIISLLDSEDYFEETADFLHTTTLKLRHLTVLSLLGCLYTAWLYRVRLCHYRL